MYRDNLDKESQECPNCKSKSVGIDNWGLVGRIDDWFYYCKCCDCTWEE